jgi:hypothetical protein
VDENRATNEAFQSTYRTPVTPASHPAGVFLLRLILSRPNAHLVPSPGNPVIDLARRKTLPTASCFRCGKPGHFSKECPDHFDVRNLSIDELQEELENRLAKLDVAPPELPVNTEEEAMMEDFPKDDE